MRTSLIVLFCFLLTSCFFNNKSTDEKLILVWSDEFDEAGIPDSTKWVFEEGFIRNHEDQYYTNRHKNVRVEARNLVLEALKEEFKNEDTIARYTSASISTEGKASWKYGKIEVRAKLPQGVGLWPAIWMLGDNYKDVGWPMCGEIDIMEHVGFEKDSIFGTIHSKAFNHMIGTQKGKKISIKNPYDEFHTYAIVWTTDKIDFLLDDAVYYTINKEQDNEDGWPFDQPFFLKINIAVGGMLGGQKGIDDRVFPQKMIVDYVRVYQ